MASLFWREGGHVEVLRRDAARIGHHFLCNDFEVSLKVYVCLVVIKVLINDAVNVHEVLDDSPAEGQRGFDLLTPEATIGHLEGELALSIDAVCSLLVVLEQHAEGMVFPVKLLKNVESKIVLIEVQVRREQICPVNAELIAMSRRSTVEGRLT